MSIHLLALMCAVFWAATVDAQRCCTPDQWEGFQGSIAGYVKGFLRRRPGVERGGVQIFYDFTNQQTAAFANYTGSGGVRSYRILRKYEGQEDGQLYVVDLKNGKCYQKKLTEPFRAACIPDKAKPFGPFYYGAGDSKLEAMGYELGIETEKYKMEFSLAVTKENCIPVGETVVGVARGIPVMESVGFVNIKPGISDPSVFDVPSQCESVVPGFIAEELTYQYKHLAIV